MSAKQSNGQTAPPDNTTERIRAKRLVVKEKQARYEQSRRDTLRLRREWREEEDEFDEFLDTMTDPPPLFEMADKATSRAGGDPSAWRDLVPDFAPGVRVGKHGVTTLGTVKVVVRSRGKTEVVVEWDDRPGLVTEEDPAGLDVVHGDGSASAPVPHPPVQVPANRLPPAYTCSVCKLSFTALNADGVCKLCAAPTAAQGAADSDLKTCPHCGRRCATLAFPADCPECSRQRADLGAQDVGLLWEVGLTGLPLLSAVLKARVTTVGQAAALDASKPPRGLSRDQAVVLIRAAREWVEAQLKGEPKRPSLKAAAGKCRICSCTDTNCGGCYDRTGEPCSWVDDAHTLCSACQPLLDTPIKDTLIADARDLGILTPAGITTVGQLLELGKGVPVPKGMAKSRAAQLRKGAETRIRYLLKPKKG